LIQLDIGPVKPGSETNIMMEYSGRIAVIRTEHFVLGFMGRMAGRSLMRELTRYMVIINQGHPVDVGLVSGHAHIMETFEQFNSETSLPKILLVRDPLQRAYSGAKVLMKASFHGAPYLHNIDTDSIDYIINYNQIADYVVNYHIRESTIPPDTEFNKFKKSMKYTYDTWSKPNIIISGMIEDWEVSDYDYENECALYTTIVNSKPELDIDTWRKWISNIKTINMPKGEWTKL
jgi:hypothetical protein